MQSGDRNATGSPPARFVTGATRYALMILLAPAMAHAQAADSTTMRDGRMLTQEFYQGSVEAVSVRFSEALSAGIGGSAGLSTFRSQVMAQLGEEIEVLDERVTASGQDRVYHRSARFANFGGAVAVVWAFDPDNRVSGFVIRPEEATQEAADSRFLDYETRTELRLPFEEEWTVVWGGRTVAENYHAAHSDQRFAYDLLIVEDGRSHRGDGRRNEDYHCFGRAILAPAQGVAVVAVDGIADNPPGEFDSTAPPGNHVVIDHGHGEFSFLAHLRQNTLRVSPGDSVERGQVLGECGNSGRSSEPHLHYHLQNTPDFGRGEGLPASFVQYLADDVPVQKGEPVRGQRIRPRRVSCERPGCR